MIRQLTVDDIRKAVNHLKSKGVSLDEIDHLAIKIHPTMLDTALIAQEEGIVEFVKIDDSYIEMDGIYLKKKEEG